MIMSTNAESSIEEFTKVIEKMDELLNEDSKINQSYYKLRTPTELEEDVFHKLQIASKGTMFEGTIKLVSGQKFPDIIAGDYYGVEVKSTVKNQWTSTGSSILESTRVQGIEKIFLTFAKIGSSVEFVSKPYEKCMADIVVTHYPRYKIDMNIEAGETIFDKMGITYDDFRILENPAAKVAEYYQKKLQPGESLWWCSGNADHAVPLTVKLWSTLSPEEKHYYIVYGYTLFPELIGAPSNKKYNRYALWLATQMGIVNTSIRDGFSAGGKVDMISRAGKTVRMPAVFGRIQKYRELINDCINSVDEEVLKECWQIDDIGNDRLKKWCTLVAESVTSDIGYVLAFDILTGIFPEVTTEKQIENDNSRIKYGRIDQSYLRVADGSKNIHVVTCKYCGEKYVREQIFDVLGTGNHEDTCPYCNGINGVKYSYIYTNKKLTDYENI